MWPPADGDWDGVVTVSPAAAGNTRRSCRRAEPGRPYSGPPGGRALRPDHFHPTRAGTYLAALVIFGGLADRTTVGLTQQRPINGLSVQSVSILEHAADEANRTYGRP